MGFSARIRVAPGLSFSASSRGVRSSIGPRAARMNVGGGRTTVSSGFGSFTASTGIGGRSAPAPQVDLMSVMNGAFAVFDLFSGPLERALDKQIELLKLARKDEKRISTLTSLHRARFPDAARQVAKREREKWWRKATPEAHAIAAAQQDVLNAGWEAVSRHEPAAVISAVDDAFADNVSLSTCIDAGVFNGQRYVSLSVIYPGPEFTKGYVIDGKVARQRNKQERAQLYREAFASAVIATSAEAFVTAPAAEVAYVVVLREEKVRRWSQRLAPIYGAALTRPAVMGPDWKEAAPGDTVWHCDYVRAGSEKLQPLDRASNGDLYSIAAALSAAVDESWPPE